MNNLNHRIWHGDLEVVYEQETPYCHFLTNIATISDSLVVLAGMEEHWFRVSDDEINIRVRFHSVGKTYTLWTKRQGDFLNLSLLSLINLYLNLTEYQFESSYQTESVYFIHAEEKRLLATQGVIFEKQDVLSQFEFILYNVMMNLAAKDNADDKFTYELITILNQNIEEYHRMCSEEAKRKTLQNTIRLRLFMRMNWQKVADWQIETDKLYHFAHNTVL